MPATSIAPIAVGLDDYVTDGTHLFRVIDVVEDEAALLENAYNGQVAWQSLDDHASVSLRRIVPKQFDLVGGDQHGHRQADSGGTEQHPAGAAGGEA